MSPDIAAAFFSNGSAAFVSFTLASALIALTRTLESRSFSARSRSAAEADFSSVAPRTRAAFARQIGSRSFVSIERKSLFPSFRRSRARTFAASALTLGSECRKNPATTGPAFLGRERNTAFNAYIIVSGSVGVRSASARKPCRIMPPNSWT